MTNTRFADLKSPGETAFYLFILVLGMLAIVVVSACFLLGTVDQNFLFNSDSMYLPVLFDDVFKEGGNFFSWHLTPAPGFFPDMALFFSARAFVSNTFWNFVCFAALQAGLSFVINLLLISTIEGDPPKRRAACLTFATLFVTAIALFTFKNSIPYVHILVPVYRFGAVFNTLILILLLFKGWNKQHPFTSLGVFLISALATATDIMFLPMAVVPAISSLLFLCWRSGTRVSKRWGLSIALVMIAGAFFGYLGKNLLLTTDTTSRYIGLGYTPLLQQVKSLALLIHQTNSQNPLIGLSLLGFYLAISLKLSRFLNRQSEFSAQNSEVFYLLLFLIVSPAITFIVVILNGIIVGAPHDLRYISNFYWLPVFFSWLPFYPDFFSRQVLKISALSLSAFAVLQLFPMKHFQTNYFPEIVGCVDGAIAEYKAQTGEVIDEGVSFYWEAKLVSHFSKENLEIHQFLPDLSPYLWINNEDWYADRQYDFAVLTAPEQSPEAIPMKKAILSLNGMPKEIKICSLSDGRDFEIMVYGSEKLRTH